MFIEHYLIELRRDGYRPRAAVRYVRSALAYARGKVLANPAGVRSVFLVGLLLFLGAIAAAVGLALVTDAQLARRVFFWTAIGLLPLVLWPVLHIDLLRDRKGYALDALGWPTAITLLRLALVPSLLVFLIEGHHRLAFWTFLFAAVTDVADGWLARRFGQETRMGAILDPVADILFSFWMAVGLYAGGSIPLAPFALAAARTGLLLGGGIYLYVAHGPVRVRSTIPGKLTGLLLGALVGTLLYFSAYGGGGARLLRPLFLDALTILLAFTLLYGLAIGWANLLHLRGRGASSEAVVEDIRIGA